MKRFLASLKDHPVTTGLILVNIAFFIFTLLLGASFLLPDPLELVAAGANFNPLTFDHQPFRLLTAAFLHAGIIHLSVNMFSLYSIGRAIESREGAVKYLVIYLVSALSSSLCSSWFSVFKISVGASGAIFGLLGYFCVVNLLHLFSDVRANWKGFRGFLYILVFNLGLGFAVPFIDNAAHLGGFFAGILITCAYMLPGIRRAPAFRRHVLIILPALMMMYGTYVFIPRYQVWFYNALSLYFHNGKEAEKLLNAKYATRDQAITTLQEAERIWKLNSSVMKREDPQLPASLASDVKTLSRHAGSRARQISLFRQGIIRDDKSLIDSAAAERKRMPALSLHYDLEEFFTADSLERK